MAMAQSFAMLAILATPFLQLSYSKRVDAQDVLRMDVDDELFKVQLVDVIGGKPLKLMSLNVEFFHEMCDKKPTDGTEWCKPTQDVDIQFKKHVGAKFVRSVRSAFGGRPVHDELAKNIKKALGGRSVNENDMLEIANPDPSSHAAKGNRLKMSWKDFLTLNVSKIESYLPIKLTIPNIEDNTCESKRTQMFCCNTGGPIELACQAKKCYDKGPGSASRKGIWPSYKRNDPQDKEPRCLQGSRQLLEEVVRAHRPHVVATQEDFENYPLEVQGYTTIISADSHAQWYKVGSQTLSLLNSKGEEVHMVNALLVDDNYFNEEKTKELCEGKPGSVFKACREDGACKSVSEKVFRCGVDLRSEAAAKAKEELNQGYTTLNGEKETVSTWKNNGVDGSNGPRAIGDDADQILLMASRCAALAAVGAAGKHIVVASVHLTGGRFDDDLIGIPNKKVEALQKEEKIHQTRALMGVLQSQTAPSIIMGDFNGPDDFDIQWWKVLTTPWPAIHPKLGQIFEGQAGVEGPHGLNQKNLVQLAKQPNADVEWLPKFHTEHPESIWKGHPKQSALNEFEKTYEHWMVGMHEFLREKNWVPMLNSKDMTVPFTKERGTTSKFGGVIDFFYASPGFIGSAPTCQQAPRNASVDFSKGSPDSSVFVKKCDVGAAAGKPSVAEWSVKVVNGVLKRSTDHAPVIVEMTVSR